MRTVITKIEGLLARAGHPSTPEEEARTAAVVAARLIAQHQVKVMSASQARDVLDTAKRATAAETRAQEVATAAARQVREAQEAISARVRAVEAATERRIREVEEAAEQRVREAEERARAAAEAVPPPPPSGARRTAKRKAKPSAEVPEPRIPNPNWGAPPSPGPACHGSVASAGCNGPTCGPASDRAAPPSAKGRRILESRFRGVCDHCDRGFQRGERISWVKGGPVYHEGCAGHAAA